MPRLCIISPDPILWNFGLGLSESVAALNLDIVFVGAPESDPELTLTKIEDVEADAYFFLCGDMHMPYLFDTEEKRLRLRALGKPLIDYANETIINTPWREFNKTKGLNAIKTFDHFLSQDENDLEFLRSHGATAEFLPQFADHRRYVKRRNWDDRPQKAFSFGQTSTFGVSTEIYKDRRRIVQALANSSIFTFVSGHVGDPTRSPEPLVSLYNDYRICVCLPTSVGGITTRFYEAALCGNSILHYELEDQPLSRNILQPGIHCLTYDRADPEDLHRKIQWLIDNPEQAKALASNAHDYVLKNHTIEQRLRQIMAFVDELCG